MPTKTIVWFGRSCQLACDGQCDKAWGLNGRPKRFYMRDGVRELATDEEPVDHDDYVFLADPELPSAPRELPSAPRDPGTYEGGHGKPSGKPLQDPARMNKWCSRECERSQIFELGEPVTLRNYQQPVPNLRKRHSPT